MKFVLFATAASAHVQLGPRPEWLVGQMEDSPLKESLMGCLADPDQTYEPTIMAIGHRGAALMFPEHSAESYRAAATTGAGIVECDVAVTSDGELVCRHSQCDLHTTTNILTTPLAAKCTTPFSPFDAATGARASAKCCTTDITLADFKTLCAKMDASVSTALTAAAYQGGTAPFRTDLYAQCGEPVSHAESIQIIQHAGAKFTPELKTYDGPYTALSYDAARAKVVQEYVDAGIPATDVWMQSFNLADIQYWIANYPNDFGRQAVYLDGIDCDGTLAGCPQISKFPEWKAAGVQYYAPPMQMLVRADSNGEYAPSELALAADAAGFKIITWTLERSGPLSNGGGWYYGTVASITKNDGDMMELLDVLVQQVGVIGVFSDWPATVAFYANCMTPIDSNSWHKKGNPSKGCKWVASYAAKRCAVRGNDGSTARGACMAACM
eukprot:CAMPEP_0184252410 /NCGR_PEP_ID=MMETSP0977-20130417/5976_1 /TAXON_ID=483370 /ORGANISM="non described non described, Strain CCMP2097" /LENGTH=439 /DNA_ID=CAMNT_0026557889 /DNA_START=27 /DNA_END=1346 /DNA_ORIENTATION=-